MARRGQTFRRACGSLPSSLRCRLAFEPLEDRRLLAITVDTLQDVVDSGDGLTSLREAAATANVTLAPDTINFAPSLTAGGPATLTLTQGELKVGHSLTIQGPGSGLLTIDTSGSDPTPDVDNHDGSRLISASALGGSVEQLNLSLFGLRVTGGDAFLGGAILATGNVALSDVIFEDNNAYGGGGLFVTGNVTISNSLFQNNRAFNSAGAMSVQGDLTITHSRLTHNLATGNYGGAIDNWNGDLLILGSDLSHNTARYGGAIQTGVFTCEIRDSTFTHNRVTGSNLGGGAIFLNEWSASLQTLTIVNSTFSDNEAVIVNPPQANRTGGGAILSFGRGPVLISDSIFRDNQVTGATGANGGALAIGATVPRSLSIVNSQFEDNQATGQGGGIYARSVELCSIIDSKISGKESVERGGGFYSFGNVNLERSIVERNHTIAAGAHGGGISAGRLLTITDSSIYGNYTVGDDAKGGGLFAPADQQHTITRSTIAHNSTAGLRSFGGGVFAGARLYLIDSTVSGNQTTGDEAHGGGIYAPLYLSAVRSTIVHNSVSGGLAEGGGAAVRGSFSTVRAPGTIVAQNTNASGPSDVQTSFPINAPQSLIGIDPKLGPLRMNGGPTMTHAPLPGSPVIDMGPFGFPTGTDQRGIPFVRTYNGDGVGTARADIGAVEFQPNPFSGDYNFNGAVDAADYSVWRDTLGSTTDLRADGSGATDGVPDGVVDQLDYAHWKVRFGSVLSLGSAAVLVGAESSSKPEGEVRTVRFPWEIFDGAEAESGRSELLDTQPMSEAVALDRALEPELLAWATRRRFRDDTTVADLTEFGSTDRLVYDDRQLAFESAFETLGSSQGGSRK